MASAESASALIRPKPVRSPFFLRQLRARPHLYSAICRARMLYSRRVAAAVGRRQFRANARLFVTNDFERSLIASLRRHGYALAPGFFSAAVADSLSASSDCLFRALSLDPLRSYSVQSGHLRDFSGLTYDDLAVREKLIAVRDPLLQIPELFPVAFHETILKVVANFLGYIPPLCRVTVVRDFPHNRPLHSSNFHKDNDECDSLQIFIYLVDIDDTRGPLVYIPGSHRYDARSCRPRLSRDLGLDANDGRLSDEEVSRVYPRNSWVSLRTVRGSVAWVYGNGIHKGPAWPRPGDPSNQPRTAIKIDIHGYKSGIARDFRENRIAESALARLTPLQLLFAHASPVEDSSVYRSAAAAFAD
ncbi:MAG TPA: phytanoyl-CoA dioxygenase family protein [Candidatus Acidoferrum sp.]|nr:phytanoyl-CoA dioxygenase family protein [Candidatus Acidoferrum sp.]